MTTITSRLVDICNALNDKATLVAVSKYHPAQSILEAYSAGQRIFGESRAQELKIKANALPDDIQWHFIGHLQTNKVRPVVAVASLIQSVDSIRLIDAINSAASAMGKVQKILLQIHIALEEQKFGFDKEEVVDAMLYCQNLQSVEVIGLMAMATFTDDSNEIKKEFTLAKDIFDACKSRLSRDQAAYNKFDTLSMGMSDDYNIALECGSTMVRIGSTIFGARNY